MLKRIAYLLFNPYVFKSSVLQKPRTACLFILSMPLLIIFGAIAIYAKPAPPWSGILSVLMILCVGMFLSLYRAVRKHDVVHAWAYMRGKDGADFWRK